MENIESALNALVGLVWGEFVLIPLLSLVGVYLTIGLRAVPWRYLPYAVTLLRQRSPSDAPGEISPFQALMTALSATIGTGNIAGVATAIYFGGPGALFWMWIIALLGMATKYSEALLAVKFRQVDRNGHFVGGPMYYIKNGLGVGWLWLARLFAVFGMIAAFGIGNMVQSNSVADVLATNYAIPTAATGFVIALITAIVIIGGVRRIADVAARLVPLMAIGYLGAASTILILNYARVPDAFTTIVSSAFSGHAATGGFLGASIWMAIRFGVARGIFSNESGLGSAAIAHGAAKTSSPARQGMVAMLGTFIDTIIVCTMTGLVLVVTDAWQSGTQGASMSAFAFSSTLGETGAHIVAIGLAVFAFTTIIGWSYYGERCAAYLFGTSIVFYYRVAWIGAIIVGAQNNLEFVWAFADLFNGLMAIPNLIALALLSPVVFSETRQYLKSKHITARTDAAND
ncbi:MAG: sodium:alanine symporter family protein [Proteobacteria bacterium]|nr:sodium:alanine symporter family protein [Pseudomonadota bacterium]